MFRPSFRPVPASAICWACAVINPPRSVLGACGVIRARKTHPDYTRKLEVRNVIAVCAGVRVRVTCMRRSAPYYRDRGEKCWGVWRWVREGGDLECGQVSTFLAAKK